MTLVLFLGGAGVSVVIMRKPGKTRTSSQLLTGRRRPALVIVALGLTMAALAMPGCASTYPNRAVVGERLPSVTGESLAGKPVRLPEDLEGQPAVLLLGYTQRAQFDADRWILGLIQAGVKTRLLEVPTIEGLMPRAFSDRIDEGTRRSAPDTEIPYQPILHGYSTITVGHRRTADDAHRVGALATRRFALRHRRHTETTAPHRENGNCQ